MNTQINSKGKILTIQPAQRIIILLFISAFGPYIFPQAGLRLEHFFIYGVVLYIIISTSASKHPLKFDRFVFTLLCLSCLTLFWITIVSIFSGGFGKLYGALAGLENFLQPIALILISSWYFSKLSYTDLLSLFNTACITLNVLLTLNSVIAIASVFFDTWPFLSYFVVAGDAGGGTEMNTVSQLSATMGRFSGIFNQPIESGLAYSIGILCWVYLANTVKKINYFGWIAVAFLLVGGALSVSKIFIIVGLPLAVLYYGWLNIGRVRFRKSTLAGFIIIITVVIGVVIAFVDNWTGWIFLIRLFDFKMISDKGFIATYTAGRINTDDSGVMSLFTHTWSESPIFGFGVPVEGILDNAYLEFFNLGGIVALAFYIFMLLTIVYVTLTRRKNDMKCGKFLFLLWLLTVIAGIGAPVFTINRASIFFWILLILGILILKRRQGSNYLPIQVKPN